MHEPTVYAFVIESTAAGSKKNAVRLMDHLRSAGARVLLFYADGRADAKFLGEELPRLRTAGVECHRIPAGNRVDGRIVRSVGVVTSVIWRRVPRSVPVVIHGHSSIGGVVARIAGLLLNVSGRRTVVIYTPHAPITLNVALSAAARRTYGAVEAVLARVTHRVIAVSQDEARHLRTLGIMPGKVRTIVNGIEVPSVLPERTLESCRRLLFVGRLDEQKDPLAAVSYASRIGNSTLDVVGGGPHLDDVVAAAAALAGHYTVTVHGYQAAVEPHYRRAHYVLISSRYEGLPYTALEAVAYGCLVLARPGPGVDELIRQGVVYDWTAVDPNQLTPESYQRLRHQAFQALKDHYDEETMLRAYENIYQQ